MILPGERWCGLLPAAVRPIPAGCLEFCWLSLCLPAYTHMTSESKKKLHLSSFLFNCLVENVQTAAIPRVFPVGTVVKKSACQWRRCKDARDRGLITESGRSPGEGHGNQLQYSCGKPHGQRSLAGYSLWGHKESDMTKRAHTDTHTHCCPNACFRNRRTAGSSAPWTAQAS